MNDKLKHNELTDVVISCFYTVYNALGYGFLEKVYENALLHELTKRGVSASCQFPIIVYYDGKTVGEYFADMVVESSLIIEIKAAKNIIPEHEAQLLNYLKATDIEVGLLLNFGPKPEFRRKAFDNSGKSNNDLFGTRITSDERGF
ncbi:MAG: GxxExxY protein [Deltaproteobacteria bacterium]|nr:GxxExxY protein [Deltaproteobacteria bacterium]